MQNKVPRVGTLVAGNVVDSDYCNYLGDAKSSYLCFGSIFIEDCYYGNPYYSKDCVDSLLVRDCELCYQCITSEGLFSCFYCTDCFNSNNLTFCYDCKGCSDCIGCSGLRNVNCHIFNKQVSQQEFEKFKRGLNFCDLEQVNDIQEKLEKEKLKTIRRSYQGIKNINVSGDYINESKNAQVMFDVKRCEDSKYCAQVIDLKDCQDLNYSEEAELCYEYIGSWKNYRAIFSMFCYQCNDVSYCDQCDSSKNLFGCCQLSKKEYCILNKQYSRQKYEQLRDKIIEQMKKDGEYGEFFSINKSLFCYNETVASEYFPISEDEAGVKAWSWKEKDIKDYHKQTYQVALNINEVEDEILQQVLACRVCTKNYKLIKPELTFYRGHCLPIPQLCPDCRHLARMGQRNSRRLYIRQCDNCKKEMQTTYLSDRQEKIYCEVCYQKEVY